MTNGDALLHRSAPAATARRSSWRMSTSIRPTCSSRRQKARCVCAARRTSGCRRTRRSGNRRTVCTAGIEWEMPVAGEKLEIDAMLHDLRRRRRAPRAQKCGGGPDRPVSHGFLARLLEHRARRREDRGGARSRRSDRGGRWRTPQGADQRSRARTEIRRRKRPLDAFRRIARRISRSGAGRHQQGPARLSPARGATRSDSMGTIK